MERIKEIMDDLLSKNPQNATEEMIHIGKCCEKCAYYHMIDSGYGHCDRFPPQPLIASIFPRLK